MIGFIYLITNKHNGRRYVGQTTQTIAKRWMGHCTDSNRYFNYPIVNALNKYGPDSFIVQELARVESADVFPWLNFLEPLYIKTYDTIKPNGYNLSPGGNHAPRHPDTRAKLSAAHKGRKYPSPSAETRMKLSLANKGKKRAASTKAKNSAAAKGNKWCVGRIPSEETRAKMGRGVSAALRGRPQSREHVEKRIASTIQTKRAKKQGLI